MKIEVLFAPAEFEALASRDLSRTCCVVFDILRATTSMVTALHHGAEAILPVATIEEALAERNRDSSVLLAGERDGLRITSAQTGGTEFDLGNSPREFTAERVRGRRIAVTTTNGTRALKACMAAAVVLPAAFLNLATVADEVRNLQPEQLLLVCGGTHAEAAFEDALAAGALLDGLPKPPASEWSDSAAIAWQIFDRHRADPRRGLASARNARRLAAIPELAPDIEYALRTDSAPVLARLGSDGMIRARILECQPNEAGPQTKRIQSK